MCIRLKYRIFLYCGLILLTLGVSGYLLYLVDNKLPDRIILKNNEEKVVDLDIPFTGEIVSLNVSGNMVSSVNFNRPVTISTGEAASYNVKLKLFGFINYKNIQINVVENKELYACGIPVGVYLKSDGILVINTASFTDKTGMSVCPAANIIQSGDYIMSVNSNPISDKMELIDSISESGGNPVVLNIRRDDNYFDVKITPQADENGDYKLGIWIRDDMQGIGTLTFVDEQGRFGSLGHGISDIDTGEIFMINDGILYNAEIYDIIKGKTGIPGEYVGTIDYSSKNILGRINTNSRQGVFGIAGNDFDYENKFEKYEVAYKYDVELGTAYIISGTDENVKKYEINITHIDYSNNNYNKGIEFTVTDSELLELTNGIVQGMSGSPIIQDNHIIGAVTHVFVNDSTKGFGIFIENMME
jgi:stage IV sporulation protein B